MKWQVVSVVLHVVTLGLLLGNIFVNVELTHFLQREIYAESKAIEASAHDRFKMLGIQIGELSQLAREQSNASVASLTYIDESAIPPLLRAVEMGAAYPHIVIDGERLDYHADKGHYCYAGSDDRAMWFGFGKDRQLGIPDKIDPQTGKRLVRRNGKWIEEEKPQPAKKSPNKVLCPDSLSF